MRKIEHELQVGDTLKTTWKGQTSTIRRFKEYTGPIDFVARIAVFTDGTCMSLEKGNFYELADGDEWNWKNWLYGEKGAAK